MPSLLVFLPERPLSTHYLSQMVWPWECWITDRHTNTQTDRTDFIPSTADAGGNKQTYQLVDDLHGRTGLAIICHINASEMSHLFGENLCLFHLIPAEQLSLMGCLCSCFALWGRVHLFWATKSTYANAWRLRQNYALLEFSWTCLYIHDIWYIPDRIHVHSNLIIVSLWPIRAKYFRVHSRKKYLNE